MNLLIKIIKKILKLIAFHRKKLVYFSIPNITNRIHSRVKFSSTPHYQQRTVLTGLGSIKIGRNCSFGFKLGGFHHKGTIEIQARYVNAIINIGDNINTNNNIFICCANYIEIGDNTLIGQNVTIMDHETHDTHSQQRRIIGEIGNVIIGKNVWIGNNVTILKNTIIGDNTIIATGAVVVGEFPNNVIIGGIPAKTIKQLG